jgi:hypothetical protein
LKIRFLGSWAANLLVVSDSVSIECLLMDLFWFIMDKGCEGFRMRPRPENRAGLA